MVYDIYIYKQYMVYEHKDPTIHGLWNPFVYGLRIQMQDLYVCMVFRAAMLGSSDPTPPSVTQDRHLKGQGTYC